MGARREVGRWIDLTRPLFVGMEVYPGDPPFSLNAAEDGGFVVSSISTSVHAGTHIDAPAHIAAGAQVYVDAFPLELMTGRALVMGARDITSIPPGLACAFIRGGGLTVSEAEALSSSGVRLAGFEGMSAAREGFELEVHRALLGRGGFILENIDLSRVADGFYEYICLPLAVISAEAAPARVLIRRAEFSVAENDLI